MNFEDSSFSRLKPKILLRMDKNTPRHIRLKTVVGLTMVMIYHGTICKKSPKKTNSSGACPFFVWQICLDLPFVWKKLCQNSPQKPTPNRQKFYISGRSRYSNWNMGGFFVGLLAKLEFTLPEINSSHLSGGRAPKGNYIFQPQCFRCFCC